MNYIGANWGIF